MRILSTPHVGAVLRHAMPLLAEPEILDFER